MVRFRRVLSLVRVLVVLSVGVSVSGGCPLSSISSSGDGSSTSSSDDSSSTAGDSTTQEGQDFQDQLADEFPGCSEADDADELRDEILRLVNEERQLAGLSPLTHNQTLEDQATQYACEMISYGFFAHENPVTGTDLADRAAEFGYDYLAIGENLAAGQPTPVRAMADWMASTEGHRENILNANFTELGVGVRTGGEFKTYWVQEFGQPLNP